MTGLWPQGCPSWHALRLCTPTIGPLTLTMTLCPRMSWYSCPCLLRMLLRCSVHTSRMCTRSSQFPCLTYTRRSLAIQIACQCPRSIGSASKPDPIGAFSRSLPQLGLLCTRTLIRAMTLRMALAIWLLSCLQGLTPVSLLMSL